MKNFIKSLSITLSAIMILAGFYVVLSELKVNTTMSLYVFKMLGVFGIFIGLYACRKTIDLP